MKKFSTYEQQHLITKLCIFYFCPTIMKEDRILKIKSRKILRNKKELVISQSAPNHVPISHFFLLKLMFSRYPPQDIF